MMGTVAPSSEQAAELLQNLSLDSEAQPSEFPHPHKQTSVNQYPNLVDPTFGYFPFCYPSYPFVYGGYDVDGNPYGEYPGFAYADGSETTMGYYYPGPIPRRGSPYGFLNSTYTIKFYRSSGYGFGSGGYGSKLNTKGRFPVDSKYKNRGHGNGYCGYCDGNIDCLKELSKGPRFMGAKNQIAAANENSSEEKDEKSITPDREQFNQADFPVDYINAKFFVVKSYSEDDVHMCVKYNVWSSTPKGNKKLDEAYHAAQQNSSSCPVFLLFSVNASGHFVGLAEMVGPVDFNKNVEYWQDNKWMGCFPVKWHIVKDVPNNLLKHITLENNENKPITNSRDTQEVMLDHGLKIIKIFKNHTSKTSILDDFQFYELRHESIQERKAKQQRFQKQQLFAEKTSDEKKPAANESNNSLEFPSGLNIDPVPTATPNGDLKPLDNGLVSEAEGNLKMSQPITTTEKNTY